MAQSDNYKKGVAVRKHERPFRQRQIVRVGQQAGAGGRGKLLAQRKVAVAVHDEDLQPGLASGMQGGGDPVVVRIVDVVADPDLEQVAEDVQGLGLAGAAGQKAEEQSSRPG